MWFFVEAFHIVSGVALISWDIGIVMVSHQIPDPIEPAFLKNKSDVIIEDYTNAALQLKEDPMMAVELMAQSMSDTVEEEGIMYVSGGALTYLIPSTFFLKVMKEGSALKDIGKARVADGKGGKVSNKSLKDISHPVLDNTRIGSALKKPDGQHGFNDIIDNYTPQAIEFEIVSGDGVKRKLYQIEGGMKYYDYKDVYNKNLRVNERITTVKDENEVFEWIVDPSKGVTHRRFIPDGQITGSPNQRP
ncbi:hypothetical protein [Pseudogracilibacillus sp. SO30301A]|uniref:hypothetical protein n=1 Tax=Pseudogracilibacillus sp. SO30301A TaxID=3098291 RepID=UPI00300E11FF